MAIEKSCIEMLKKRHAKIEALKELLKLAHESLDSKDVEIAELEKEHDRVRKYNSSLLAKLKYYISEEEAEIRDIEQQAKGISDFVSSIEGFSEGYIQALKGQDND
jgi:Na+/phosphate symporter